MVIFATFHSEMTFMKFNSLLLLVLPLLILTSSCETDFDVTADYKEIAIVYGLLSQNDTVHYLRINKAYLGDGNALIYAANHDSSSFGTSIEVIVTETNMNGIQKTIVFDTTTIHDKKAGIFYSPDQLMYKATAILNPLSTYTLKVKNKTSGNEVTSVTNLIQDFSISKPAKNAAGIRRFDFKRDTISMQKIEWSSAVNGRLYQPILRFYFKEINFTGDTITREIEWKFASYKSSSLEGGEKLSVDFKSEEFYKLCEDNIPYADIQLEEDVSSRLVDHFVIDFTVVGDEFSTYLDVNGPTTGLLLEKPSYSNITNGLGLFSSIYKLKVNAQVGDKIKADLQVKTDLHFFAN